MSSGPTVSLRWNVRDLQLSAYIQKLYQSTKYENNYKYIFSHLSMSAFKDHCECTMSYQILSAELEFPDSLHFSPVSQMLVDYLSEIWGMKLDHKYPLSAFPFSSVWTRQLESWTPLLHAMGSLSIQIFLFSFMISRRRKGDPLLLISVTSHVYWTLVAIVFVRSTYS